MVFKNICALVLCTKVASAYIENHTVKAGDRSLLNFHVFIRLCLVSMCTALLWSYTQKEDIVFIYSLILLN